jgi:hypothetical protein
MVPHHIIVKRIALNLDKRYIGIRIEALAAYRSSADYHTASSLWPCQNRYL